MKRIPALLAVLLLVAGSLAAVPASGALAGLQASAPAAQTTTADTAAADAAENGSADVSPGAHLSGAVGVQGSELRGDVESRRFGIRVARADSPDAKAQVLAEQVEENRRQVDQLQQRLDELKQARENGSIGPGEYAVRAAEIHAELNNVQHMSNQSAAVARGLPEETLRANGVNVTAIERLRERAANASGPEVAGIARTIAGSSHRPGTVDAANRSDGRADGNNPDAGSRTGAGNAPDAGTQPVDIENRTGGAARGSAGGEGTPTADGNVTIDADGTVTTATANVTSPSTPDAPIDG
ncbi:MAG: hypothetical protein ABEJ74_02100 [Haloferacaceae archaeon]